VPLSAACRHKRHQRAVAGMYPCMHRVGVMLHAIEMWADSKDGMSNFGQPCTFAVRLCMLPLMVCAVHMHACLAQAVASVSCTAKCDHTRSRQENMAHVSLSSWQLLCQLSPPAAHTRVATSNTLHDTLHAPCILSNARGGTTGGAGASAHMTPHGTSYHVR
jgi:hypothetical protein